ncbi:hypothetical protein [Brucepastera parasyntrophica]
MRRHQIYIVCLQPFRHLQSACFIKTAT